MLSRIERGERVLETKTCVLAQARVDEREEVPSGTESGMRKTVRSNVVDGGVRIEA